MKQWLVIYLNGKLKLSYVGIYNDNKSLENSCSMKTNISRAKYCHKKMIETPNGNNSGLKSGFMMALINTNYGGWDYTILPEPLENAFAAAEFKAEMIEILKGFGYTFVGSDRFFVKGSIKEFGGNASWTKKWNIEAMTQAKIREKIEFIVKSMPDNVPNRIYSEAYMCTIIPDGVKIRTNYGDYQINDLVSLYKFVRNYMGYDL
ncbi:MAG: hypothetical protein COA52_00590 [Hyphomicrobiales bacterium]|nr:MAG: hypothetical protein COA52_00590 [Hyphomicrobiales bacterium]